MIQGYCLRKFLNSKGAQAFFLGAQDKFWSILGVGDIGEGEGGRGVVGVSCGIEKVFFFGIRYSVS